MTSRTIDHTGRDIPPQTRPDWLLDIEVHSPIEAIAQSLSRINRFCGNSPRAYTVAKHSVIVMHLLPPDASYNASKMALLHDGHEAYLSDMPRPLKQRLGRIIDAICEEYDDILFPRYGIEQNIWDADMVGNADDMASRIELNTLGMVFPDDIAERLKDYDVFALKSNAIRKQVAKLLASSASSDYDCNQWLWWWNEVKQRQAYAALRPVQEGEAV